MDDAIAKKYTGVAREALKAFPIVPAKLNLILQSENITFRVTDTETGQDYVLRLHRPGYHTLEELNSERIWTRALGEAGIDTQVPFLTKSGDHFCDVQVPGEPSRFAGMTQWTMGKRLCDFLDAGASLEDKKSSFRQLGGLVAVIHNQSAAWNIPHGFERHSLDTDGLMGEAPFWGRFWEHEGLSSKEQQLLLQVRSDIRKVLGAYGQSADTFGMIHADLHSENVLVHDGVVTPIDFDDAGFGWHMYDLAVALFHEQKRSDFETFQQALLEGYREHRPLEVRDLAMLPVFLLIRGMALMGWVHQRPDQNNVEYFEGLKTSTWAGCGTFDAGSLIRSIRT